MAAAAVDAAYISASYAVSEPDIQTLIDAPTSQLVQTLLKQIESKAREFDSLKAEKFRTDVELENAVRTGESRAQSLKESVDKGLKEVENLRLKLSNEGMQYDTIWVLLYTSLLFYF